jgi:hypothetical protein
VRFEIVGDEVQDFLDVIAQSQLGHTVAGRCAGPGEIDSLHHDGLDIEANEIGEPNWFG